MLTIYTNKYETVIIMIAKLLHQIFTIYYVVPSKYFFSFHIQNSTTSNKRAILDRQPRARRQYGRQTQSFSSQ